jgi:hypothetical protein
VAGNSGQPDIRLSSAIYIMEDPNKLVGVHIVRPPSNEANASSLVVYKENGATVLHARHPLVPGKHRRKEFHLVDNLLGTLLSPEMQ